jgi:ADP-ribose pyrophosphatase YjhB (NUDIX family)
VRVVVARIPHCVLLFAALGPLFLLFLGWFRLLGHARILPDVAELESWKHCPRCGTAIEPLDGGSRVECPECGFRHYASSKPTASGVVLDDDGRILLARRAQEPDKGKWDLPGGFLEEGEDPRDGLRRELLEEASLDVEPLEFFDVVVDRYGDEDDAQWTLNLYWTCRVLGGTPTPADDVDELRWFGRDELPPTSELAFRNNAKVISRWRDEHA